MVEQDVSALELAKRMERRILGMLAALDVDLLGRETTKTVALIKQLTADARLDVRDFEMADSRAEMYENSRVAIDRLHQVRSNILKASEHGIFSAIDVVQLSAELEAIMDAVATDK